MGETLPAYKCSSSVKALWESDREKVTDEESELEFTHRYVGHFKVN